MINFLCLTDLCGTDVDWVLYGKWCYWESTSGAAYSDAQDDCEDKGGNLVTVDTAAKQVIMHKCSFILDKKIHIVTCTSYGGCENRCVKMLEL